MRKLLSLISSISIVIPTTSSILAMSALTDGENFELFAESDFVKTENIKLNKSNTDYFYSGYQTSTINGVTTNDTVYIYGNRYEESLYILFKDENNKYIEKEFVTLGEKPRQIYIYNNYLHIILGKTNYYANFSDILNSWTDRDNSLTIDDFQINQDFNIPTNYNLYISTHLGFAIYIFNANGYIVNLSEENGKVLMNPDFAFNTLYGDIVDASESIQIASLGTDIFGLIKTDSTGASVAYKDGTYSTIQTTNNPAPAVTTYMSKIVVGQEPTIRNFMFDNDRIIEIDILATTGDYIVEKGEALPFTDGAKVKSIGEMTDPATGNPAIYVTTDKGVYLMVSTSKEHLIPTETNTYTVEKLSDSSNTLSNGAIRAAGNTISSYNYKTNTLEQVVKNADLSALNNEKIALDAAILAQGATNPKAVQEEIAKQIIAKANVKGIQDQISLISTSDLYNLISIDDVIKNLTPNDSYGNWYKEKTYTVGENRSYITGADVLFSSNTQLEFLKSQTLEYTMAIEAGQITDTTQIQTIVAELNKQLQTKDENLEIVTPTSINVQENQTINLDVKTVDGLNIATPITSQVQVKFTNVKVAMNLDTIVSEIQAKSPFDVNKTLDTSSSVSDFEQYLNNEIKDIANIDKVAVKITDTAVNVNNYSWTANVSVSEKEMPTNSKTMQVTFNNIAKAKVQMNGSWETGSNPSKFIVGQTMKYNIQNPTEFGAFTVTSSNDNFTATEANGVISITAAKAGNATISIAAADAKNTINLDVRSYAATLDYGTQTTFSLNEGKTKTLKLNNAPVFSEFSIDNPSSENIEVSVDSNGSIKVKALKFETEGLTYNFTIKATNSLGAQQTQTFTVELMAKVPFPLWAIILLAVLGGAIVLGGIGFFCWWLFVKVIKPAKHQKTRKHRSRTAQITADRNAVAKGKVTKAANIKHDKGLERSGLFERELEYNLDKMNDPDYEKKYVWVQDEGTEDNSPVLNNWNTDEQQTKDELKSKKNTKKK